MIISNMRSTNHVHLSQKKFMFHVVTLILWQVIIRNIHVNKLNDFYSFIYIHLFCFYIDLAKGGERAKLIKHEAQKTISAPFEGDPTYKSMSILLSNLIIYQYYFIIADYRKWEASRTEPIRHDGGYVCLLFIFLYIWVEFFP
jgi:hypothetical protein